MRPTEEWVSLSWYSLGSTVSSWLLVSDTIPVALYVDILKRVGSRLPDLSSPGQAEGLSK